MSSIALSSTDLLAHTKTSPYATVRRAGTAEREAGGSCAHLQHGAVVHASAVVLGQDALVPGVPGVALRVHAQAAVLPIYGRACLRSPGAVRAGVCMVVPDIAHLPGSSEATQ